MRGSPDAGVGGSDGDSCPDGFARGNASGTSRRIAAFTPSAEGVTVCPNGEVFVSADDGVLWRVPLDGSPTERWATVGDRQPAGITCDRQGRLFVAVYSVRSDGGSPAVMRVDRKDGDAITLPGPNDQTLFGLNGIVAIAGLGLYATDTIGGLILRLRETMPNVFETDTVATGVLFANGLAYQPSSRTLHAVSSLAMQVLTFDVATDGTLGNRKTVASRSLALFDGVAVDERGTVYAADYAGGSVLRLGDSTSVGKFTNPASLAFRGGTLLVTDYRLNQPTVEGGLYAVDLGVCGAS